MLMIPFKQRATLDAMTVSGTSPAARVRFRVLPPVGGPIPYSAVFRSIRRSLWQPETGESEATLRQLRDLLGLRYWTFTNSGRSALSVVLRALKSQRSECDEVIIPAYTSYSVPAAVVRAGLQVRLCDVEHDTLGLDPRALEQSIGHRTLCVVPHHLYGLPCRIHEVAQVCRTQGVPIVEDAAQGMGIRCKGTMGGACGDVGIFSLSRGKNLPAAGGGLIGTNDEELAKECRRVVHGPSTAIRVGGREALETVLMALFIRPSLYWLPAGLPFLKLGHSWYEPTFEIAPMSRFQHALLDHLLPTLTGQQGMRRDQAARLRLMLDGTPVRLLWPRDGDEGGFLRAAAFIDDASRRNHALTEWRRRGLGATEGYPLPLSQLPELQSCLARLQTACPVAEWVSRHLVTLPTHPWMTDDHRRQVREVVTQCA